MNVTGRIPTGRYGSRARVLLAGALLAVLVGGVAAWCAGAGDGPSRAGHAGHADRTGGAARIAAPHASAFRRGDYLYWMYREAKTGAEAKAACRAVGGRLARAARDPQFFMQYMRNLGVEHAWVGDALGRPTIQFDRVGNFVYPAENPRLPYICEWPAEEASPSEE